MIYNYFKTAFRSIKKNKLFSMLNLFGLSIGMTVAIFILQYVFFEMSFDKFNKNHKDIYRVMNDRYEGEKLIQSGQITYSAVGPQMNEDYPEIAAHITINPMDDIKFHYKDRITNVGSGFFVQPSFFEFFDYELLAGDRNTLVSELYTVVLTESSARRIFSFQGDDFSKFVGKLIKVDRDDRPLKITGILKDVPLNSHLKFDMLGARITLEKEWPTAIFDWKQSDFYHYVQLVSDTDTKSLEGKFDSFSQRHFDGNKVSGNIEKFHLQSLDDVHLYSDYEYEIADVGNGKMVWSLSIVAIFILIMAWVNYINLATSRSLERAKEVGIRKAIGANKRQLIKQFFAETILVNLLSVIVTVTFIQLFQGFFNRLVERELNLYTLLIQDLYAVPVFLIIIAIIAFGTFISGIYPAFMLSSYRPSETLTGKITGTNQGLILRKGLIVFQFCISTLLIAGTLLVYQQVNYMRNQELGMQLDQVVVVSGPSLTNFDSTFVERIKNFKNALLKNPNISDVGTSNRVFGERLSRSFNVSPEISEQSYTLNRIHADFGFLNSYKIKLQAGRDLRYTDHHFRGSKVKNLLLNATACSLLGFKTPEEAINKKLSFWGRDWYVVGVTEDFHNRSLKQSIEPIMIIPFYNVYTDNYNIRLSGHNIKKTLGFIESTYNELYQGNIFEYYFMDDRFNQQYKSDQLFGKVFNLFSMLAILIACLGLFGLAGYTAVQRTKEIGIRKVLGASIKNIIKLLSTDFVKLVIVANLIALPLVYFGANAWLANYAYSISIGAWLFFVPVMIVLIISSLTISVQTLKTARANPVDSLKID